MRKKITMLFASLLACVGVMKAEVTDLPQMTTSTDDIKWYTISNTRSTSGKYLYWTENGVKDSDTRTGASFFYVTGSADACYIHNYSTNLLFSGAGAWTEAGKACQLSVSPLGTGLMIAFDGTYLNEQNSADGYTTYWDVNDLGSIFVFEEVTDFSAIIDVNAAKDAAKAELENLATITALFPDATEAKTAVDAVVAEGTGLDELNAAVEEINAVVANYRNAAYQALGGRYFVFKPAERTTYIAMGADHADGDGTTDLNRPAQLWQFVYDNGAVNLYNPYTDKYLGAPAGTSAAIPVVDDQANAGDYALNVSVQNYIALQVGGATAHVDGYYDLVRWDDSSAGASKFSFEEVTDFSSIISAYKESTIATLDSWATLSVVFDAELITTAKTAINAINTTDYATFAAIDAELKNVTDKVAAKYFTFKNSDTSNDVRVNAYLAANMSDNEGHGTKTFGYNAIWRLISAGGTSFYLYNELNGVYLGTPSSNGDLTATPSASYSFEIVDAETNKAELKCGNETLHLNNHTDGLLSNYDNDDAASRWYIAEYDYKADLTALIEENVNSHEEVPALGKYPTAAYNALVEAGNNATTVAEVAEAIAAFEAALNRPVYFITSAHDGYAAGSAIYYDGAWKWKTANIYDRQMWMTILGYTEENVPVVDAYDANGTSYQICDFLTGTVMRGKSVQIVKIADWEGAYNLQYNADATSTDAAQHAQSGGSLVNWKAATTSDNQASAWQVEYIGNSYDLDKLTDAHIAALVGLQSAYDAKAYAADVEIGEGLGQYQGDKEAIVTVLNAGKAILDKSLVEQAALDVAAINSAAEDIKNVSELTLNMPVQGKYYRIKSAVSDKYVTAPAATGTAMTMADEASANSILYWDAEGHLLVYGTGYYINGKNHAHLGYKATYTVEGSKTGVVGAYAIKPSSANYWHDNGANLDVYQNGTHANCNWTIEEVTTLPVTISSVGYATFYAPVEVTLPAKVTAHTVTANGDYATLSEAINVVPAENGVILAGEAGDYELTITNTGAEDLENALAGTVAKTRVTKTEGDAYYVLAVKDENAGLYNPVNGENASEFFNAGHKAYWHIAAAAQSAGYRFGEGTTSIDNAQLTNDNEVVIYDLAGRRVEKMEKGIYIVNGKKVIK